MRNLESRNKFYNELEEDLPLAMNIFHSLVYLVYLILLIVVVAVSIGNAKDEDPRDGLGRSMYVVIAIVMTAFAIACLANLVGACLISLNKIFDWGLKITPRRCPLSYFNNDMEKGEYTALLTGSKNQFRCSGKSPTFPNKSGKELSFGLNKHPSHPTEREGRDGVMKPGVSALAMQIAIASEEEKKLESAVFDLKLQSYPSSFFSRVSIQAEICRLSELGIPEALRLVKHAPFVFKKGVSKEEGEQIIEKVKAMGAEVVMQ